jgi:16S rRNA (adenine1518-N6/adenine1519-N6)-dimethyltransferase
LALKIQPKKSLGQNYLTDENICRNIVDSFSIAQTDHVVEIGPGQGAITKYILQKTNNLTAVEFDRNNCAILSQKFPELNLVMGDFLKFDLDSVILSEAACPPTGRKDPINGSKLRVIGNIPYNITTEIVFKLIDNRTILKDVQLMIQEEVAQRFAAEPDNKDYGIPSVFVQVFSRPKLLFKVSKNCFYPKPKVDSRLIQFDFSYSRESEINDIPFFKKFVKTAFGMRRKTLKNTLAKLELDLSKADFDFTRRAETVTIDEFIELSNLFSPTIIKNTE